MAKEKEKDDDIAGEEYQLGDVDLMGSAETSPEEPAVEKAVEPEGDVQRSADIKDMEQPSASPPFMASMQQQTKYMIGGAILGLLVIYYVVSSLLGGSGSTTSKIDQIQPPPVKQQVMRKAMEPVQAPPQAPPQAPVSIPTMQQADFDKKIAQVTSDQMKTQADLQTISTNVTTAQASLQQISDKLSALEQLVITLNKLLDNQTHLLEAVEVKKHTVTHPRRVHHGRRGVVGGGGGKFYIQAVIPGRAWLIKPNGTDTITVREGTRIPGHGVVQVIDPSQGQVVMSSGEVITFGQWDS